MKTQFIHGNINYFGGENENFSKINPDSINFYHD